jgi:hypothetical protein
MRPSSAGASMSLCSVESEKIALSRPCSSTVSTKTWNRASLQGFRHLMDGMWRHNLKSLRQLLVGNGNSALREVLKECACLCMRGQPIVLPQARHCDDRAWSPPRADDPDRPRLLHDDLFALSISAPHPLAARLVVGPDDVRDVGVGNERYDAVALSLNGVGSEVDGGHSNPPRARGLVSGRTAPSPLSGAGHSSYRAPYTTIRMRVLSEPRKVTPSGNVIQLCPTLANRERDPVAGGCGFASRPPDRTPADTSPGPSV